MFLLVKLHTDMGLEAVLPGPQNALYVMLCYVNFFMYICHTGRITPVQPFRSVNTWLIYLEQLTDLADQPIVLAYLMMADLELFSLCGDLHKKLADLPQELAELADQPSVG